MNRLAAAAALLMLAGSPTVGCAPPAPESAADVEPDVLGAECERSLRVLDALIVDREGDASFPADKLVEARELRDAAVDLYAGGRYDIALELVDAAIFLLRTST